MYIGTAHFERAACGWYYTVILFSRFVSIFERVKFVSILIMKFYNIEIGNGLKGYLPREVVKISTNLEFLNIRYNKIRGTISDALAKLSFKSFEIDSNFITGHLKVVSPAKDSKNSLYAATVNRLSGSLNSALNSYAAVNVLDGNR